MRIKFKALDQRGIGLVETMLALGIGIIIITSMVSLAIFTLRSSLQNRLNLEGTQYANQEIEQIRAFRDARAWSEFIQEVDGSVGPDCFTSQCHMGNAAVPTVLSGEQVINEDTPEEVHKSFMLTDQSSGEFSLIRVAVTVSWNVGSDTRYAHSYTEMSNWRNQ